MKKYENLFDPQNAELLATVNALSAYTESLRPNPANFHGVKAIPEEQIKKDLRLVSDNTALYDEQARRTLTDSHLAFAAEDLLFLNFSQNKIIQNQSSLETMPGSHYDDQTSGVDLICHLPRNRGPELVFSIDVTTATSPRTATNKFESSQKGHSDTPRWSSPIRYYQSGKVKKSLKSVPHFIVGFSPEQNVKALNTVKADHAGGLLAHDDPDLRFKVLTEIFEQSLFYRESLRLSQPSIEDFRARKNHDQTRKDFGSINRLVSLELASLLGLEDFSLKDPTYPQILNHAYEERSAKLCATDPTYANILNENRRLWYAEVDMIKNAQAKQLGQKTQRLNRRLAPQS